MTTSISSESAAPALQQRAQHIVSVNEPADSPLTPAFDELGFTESDRQHEFVIDLA